MRPLRTFVESNLEASFNFANVVREGPYTEIAAPA